MKRYVLLVVLATAGLSHAVTPGTWVHKSEADFSKGEFVSTVVNSLGQVKLARAIKVILAPKDAPQIVSVISTGPNGIYAASGADGRIFRVRGGKATRFATVPATMTVSLVHTPRGLLAGTAGKGAGIYRISPAGKVSAVWTDPKVTYVWALLPGVKGVLYAATGPKGKVYAVSPQGKAEVIYGTDKTSGNILCLAMGDDGKVLAGTDRNGLVVEIDPAKKTSRVLLDAVEKEISSLLVDESGGVYVSTADVARVSAPATPNGAKMGKAARSVKSAKPKLLSKTPASHPARDAVPVDEEDGPDVHEDQKNGRSPLPGPSPAAAPGGQGNAVYYIRPDGLIETIFRRPVAILSMIRQGELLILGTGSTGDVYTVTLDGDEVARIVDTDASQVTSLAATRDGKVYFTTANKGSIAVLDKGFVEAGTFTSPALDAGQIARWGTLKIRASIRKGAGLLVSTRSGNLADPDDDTWSDWSAFSPATDGFLPIASPAGRFIQYRLKITGDGVATSAVESVQLIYQIGNLSPTVSGVLFKPSAKPDGSEGGKGPRAYRAITIAAKDPNGDKLLFRLEFRDLGATNWIEIADKLTAPKYVWNTRTVGDGKYELRVRASDSPSNPGASARQAMRISDPIVVDNTSPLFKALGAKSGKKVAIVSGQVVDAGSRIVSIQYTVDSQADWRAVLPSDGIADSDAEKFSFRVEDLKSGDHRIALRAVDLYGNVGYGAVTVTVAK